ncbi:DNA internalization-related competence protein ComEC/Rec2 [Lentibacillus cibarius]|uniref:DNA internalization-related competence protein ComEC/Rec2 n=1 Tax=Lentibacillus cibarius TaxID=2583219 RepID=A0A549YLJ8_9BACI|nr:DNA internalization-related competence protein ComEC/Rec2 [Lentibacillus cibarius]TRM12761.1 DNA internalization-related competence protein ComEC/Rec2 [Lentibacillus cibarius]
MQGYWHFPALGIVSSFLSIMFGYEWIIVLFFFWIIWLYIRHRLGKLSLIVSLAITLFFFFYLPDIEQPVPKLTHDKEQQIFGKITRPVQKTPKKIDFTVTDDVTGNDFFVTYFGDERDGLHLKYGASCRIAGTPETPDAARNPGQFDYRNYLASQGIFYQVIINDSEAITCTGSSFMQNIYQLRSDMIQYVQQHLSPQTAAWLNALVLGDDTEIDEETKELFQRWNLTHLLAISGLHVGLVVGLLYMLLVKYAGATREKAQWTVIVFLPIYALLAGGEASVLRASAMVLLFMATGKWGWKLSVVDVLSIVFMLLICFDPYIVYQVGFQLSFCVTFGLLLSKDWLLQTNSSFFTVLKISFISQMMILPLQVEYFFTFQPLSILLNTVIVPYFTLFVIPLMFTMLLLAPVAGFINPLLDMLFVTIHDLFKIVIQMTDEIAYDPMVIGSFPLLATVLYYVCFVVFMAKAESKKQKEAFAWGCSLVLLVMLIIIKPYLSPDGKVTMLDIGQGDAFVVELPYRKGVILIDAGAPVNFGGKKPSNNVYKQIIRPYLRSQGIAKIDSIFLSHADTDHMGSFPYILADMPVKHVVVSDYYTFANPVLEALKNNEVNIVRTGLGDKLTIEDGVFHVLSPNKDSQSKNENSLVLYTELGGKTWLFTGDIGRETEKEIIRLYPDLTIDVLKVAHHGSRTSTGSDFLQEIHPVYGLISAGVNNMYSHPHRDVLQSLQFEEVNIYRTDKHGAVQYDFRKGEGTFSTYLP